MIHRNLFIPLLLAALFAVAKPASAQNQLIVTDLVTAYTFGEQIIIQGRVAPEFLSDRLSIQLKFEGDENTVIAPLEADIDGAFVYVHLVSDRFVQAFSRVTFEFIAEKEDNSIITSGPFSFYYSDNRFDWQTLEEAPFRIHWHEGDLSFAQMILDAAKSSLVRAELYLDNETVAWMDIYVYPDREQYTFTQDQFRQLWAGGHVEPETGLALVILPPSAEAIIEIDRKIPHEVAHLLLFNQLGSGFANIPVWLNEGFASLLEAVPNPDDEFIVRDASQSGTLIPMADLCAAFPLEAGSVRMAYAESASFMRYVEMVYGPAGVRSLINSYAAGAGCTQGPLTDPIRLDLQTLESTWLNGLAPVENPTSESSQFEIIPTLSGSMLSWLLIFAAVLVGPGLVLIGAGLKRGQ